MFWVDILAPTVFLERNSKPVAGTGPPWCGDTAALSVVLGTKVAKAAFSTPQHFTWGQHHFGKEAGR